MKIHSGPKPENFIYLKILLVGLAYLLAARFGISFSYQFSPRFQVWPATGLALAAVLLWGRPMLLGIAGGAFFAGVWASASPIVMTALVIGATLSAWCGAFMLEEWAELDARLLRVRDVMALIVLGSIVSTALIATLMIAAQMIAGDVPVRDAGLIWLERWLAHSISVLVTTPLILVWATSRRRIPLARALEGLALLSLVLVSAWAAFGDVFSSRDLYVHLMFLPFLLLLMTTLRLGVRGAVTAATLVVAVALGSTFTGHGPFAVLTFEDPQATHSEQLALMWFFVATLMTAGMFGGAALHERRLAQMDLLEANLRSAQSVQNLRSIFRNMNEGMALLGPQGNVLDLNPAALRINGFDSQDEAMRTMGEDVLAGNFESAREALTERYDVRTADGGDAVPMERWPAMAALRGEELQDEEVQIVDRRTGREWIERFNGTRVYDDRGRYQMYILTMQDITDRVRMTQAIRESESRFRRLAETSTVGLAIGKLEGEVQYVNPALVELTGYGLGEFRLEDLLRRSPGAADAEDADGAEVRDEEILAELRERHTCEPFEARLRTRDGRELHALVGAGVIDGDGGRGDLLAVYVTDMSAQKQAERELRHLNETLEQRVRERTAESEQRSVLLKAFAMALTQSEREERRRLAGRLHDNLQQLIAGALIRLNPIRQRLEGRAEGEKLDQVAGLLKDAIEEARTLTTELSPAILNHGDISDALRWLANWMHEQYGVEVELTVEDGDYEVGDELKRTMFDCARELLRNVHQHSGVKAARMRLARCGDQVDLQVTDEGCGFDRNVLQQAPRSQNFGLFEIVERVTAFGGDVRLDSEPGQGCGVQLSLPVMPERQEDTPRKGGAEGAANREAGGAAGRQSAEQAAERQSARVYPLAQE